MKKIIKYIEFEQKKLSESEFLKWLADSSISPSHRLSFTPSMLFFIMGFKDLLESIHIKNPQTPLENIISTHCEEDLHHWKWYIEDLKTLGYGNIGNDLMDFSSDLWGKERKAARNLIYKAFNYHFQKPSIICDLVLIEVLEATFGVFVESMKKCVEDYNAYDKLLYFGKTHHDAEESHGNGNWVEGESLDDTILSLKLSSHEEQYSVNMVEELFELFEETFKMWHKIESNLTITDSLKPYSFNELQ